MLREHLSVRHEADIVSLARAVSCVAETVAAMTYSAASSTGISAEKMRFGAAYLAQISDMLASDLHARLERAESLREERATADP